ncbi:MAG: MFS transporter, partial [Actinomycetota bacterium]|nr:MFS transporter [Actinomycetota bacterium]
AMVVAGRLADRLGPRAVAPALLLFGAAVTLPGFAHSVPQLALALMFVGAASGARDVAINVAATATESSGGTRIMQLAHALFSAGFLVAAVSVGLAREAGAGPLPILMGTAFALFGVAALNRGYAAAPPRPRRRPLVFSRKLLVLGALCAVAFVVESGIEHWSALFLERELHATPAVSGLGPGLFAAAMVAGRLLGQALDVRVGDRTLLIAGAVLAGGGLALAAAAPSVPSALAGFALGGAGISVAAPILFGAAGRGAEDSERGSAVASVTTVAYLGFLAGPPLIGTVSGALDLRAGLALLAAISAALAVAAASLGGALPLRRLQPPERRQLSQPR